MNPLVTIVMRDGSKGLPGKHTRLLHGKPLWRWSWDQALEWGEGHVICASDIPDVVNQLRQEPGFDRENGVSCFALRGRRTDIKMADIRQAVRAAEYLWEDEFDPVVDLDATNPLRQPGHIDAALSIFNHFEPLTVISATPSKRSPYYNLVTEDGHGRIKVALTGRYRRRFIRRQDTPATWDLNCNIYVYDRKFLMNERNETPLVYDAKIYEMPRWTACDIDDEDDWETVEDKARRYLL